MDFCHTFIPSLAFLLLHNKGRSISPKMPYLIFSFMAGGVLPGGYNYLHISKPEVPIRLDLELALCDHVSYII